MAAASIRAAADKLAALNGLCEDYLDSHPEEAPPTALLREIANAGRDLVTAIGEHIANTPPRR